MGKVKTRKNAKEEKIMTTEFPICDIQFNLQSFPRKY